MGKSSENPMPEVSAHTPVGEAAAHLVGDRLDEVARLLEKVGEPKAGSGAAVKAVHQLRVATRRAEAALGVFEGVVKDSNAKRAGKRLRAIRKAAGEPRDLDVQKALLGAAARRADGAAKDALRELSAWTRKKRKKAGRELEKLAEKWGRKRLERKIAALVERARQSGESSRVFVEIARAAVDREVGRVREAAAANLRDMDCLHALRLELKSLRYTMETVEVCLGKGWLANLKPALAKVQKRMGEINDAKILVERLGREVSGGARNHPLRAIVAEQRELLREGHKAFLAEWKSLISGHFLEKFRDEIVAAGLGQAGARMPGSTPLLVSRVLRPDAFIEAKGHGLNGTTNGTGHGHEGKRSRLTNARRRLAAIDVGTNSIRLIVAEAQADGSYRILDDEKEITRLGQGLGKAGKLDPGAIEHTAVTVARMKSIAEGYGATGPGAIRVVGTSAAREASNTDALARQIKERTGLELMVISGEEEAMLAYRSAANAFDLASVPGAVVDIGGGSTEVVLSAAVGVGGAGGVGAEPRCGGLGGGVIERVYTVPIGAVRLTEMFGGPEACARGRFEEMREYIKGALKEQMGAPPIVPQVVVGTGGTLTTLAAMVLQRELGTGDGLFSGGVQGLEVARADLKHILAYVRKLPLKERTRVPGLSADRADIIVAGLAIVDGVLKRLGANRVRIHEGGIRDGILLSMVGNGAEGAETKRDPMRGVRRLAKACGYEAAHSRHVTGLALSIFDQLREQLAVDEQGRMREDGKVRVPEGMRFDDETRLLLEGASLLHDVGYLINYAQHHKHSYHLIVHADLPGFTTRQVRVVANVARYHRAAGPKRRHRPFASLAEADRGLVRGLSGILRIADGLDRTHMQSVRGVRVKLERGAAMFAVDAASEPGVDMWGAVRKSGLFEESLGTRAHFEWTPTDRQSARPETGEAENVETLGAVG